MKKIVSIFLMLMLSLPTTILAFAEETQNYEYILPMEFARIERLDNCYIAYDKQEKCAIYSLSGEKLTDDYDFIGPFNENGIAIVRTDNISYTVNSQGDVIGKFDKRIMDDSGTYILMNLDDANEDGRPSSYFMGEFGVCLYTGELLKVLPYEKFNPPKNSGFGITFSGNRLLFTENGLWGAIDENFNTVIEPVYSIIYPFETETGITVARKADGKYGLIDKNGNIIVDFVYDLIQPLSYSGGKVNSYIVMQGNEYMALQGEKYGMLDKYGNIIKEIDELVPQTLYEEYELISVYKKNNREDKEQYGNLYGLIDYEGNVIIPVEHTNIGHISDGIIPAQKSYDHNGYYDLNGNEITEFKYRGASPFSDGLAFVSSCIDDVWTHEVINTKGETVFNPTGWSDGFYGGIAHNADGILIDTNGEVVINNPEWLTVSGLAWWSYKNDGTFVVMGENGYGVVKYNGYISDWAKAEVDEAKNLGIINNDVGYLYQIPITREMFCEFAYNYIVEFGKDLEVSNDHKFTDTDNAKVEALSSLGIIKGKSETEFAPNDLLTREEAATILNRLINVVHPDLASTELYFEFADGTQISDWAMNDIQRICNMGVMKGVGNNNFDPKDNYTTEQAIVTLVRVYASSGISKNVIGGADEPTGILVGEQNKEDNDKLIYGYQVDDTGKILNLSELKKFYIEFAMDNRIDFIPDFDEKDYKTNNPVSTEEFLMLTYYMNKDNLSEDLSMSAELVEKVMRENFGIEKVEHKSQFKGWTYIEEENKYTPYPEGTAEDGIFDVINFNSYKENDKKIYDVTLREYHLPFLFSKDDSASFDTYSSYVEYTKNEENVYRENVLFLLDEKGEKIKNAKINIYNAMYELIVEDNTDGFTAGKTIRIKYYIDEITGTPRFIYKNEELSVLQ